MRRFLLAALLAGCASQPLEGAPAEPAPSPPAVYVVTAECPESCPWLAPDRANDVYLTSDADAARARFIADGDAFANVEPAVAADVRGEVRKIAARWTATPDGDTDYERAAPDGERLHLLIYTTSEAR